MDLVFDMLVNYWPFWVVLGMFVAGLLLLRMYSPKTEVMPYYVRDRLVTKAELRFYRSLQKAVQDDFAILVMVRIADILRVEPNAKNKRSWVGKILAKHCDFVLCDPGDLRPVMGIELDDKSHQRADRIARDEFVDTAFQSAGLPLLRIPVRAKYQSREIRDLIDRKL